MTLLRLLRVPVVREVNETPWSQKVDASALERLWSPLAGTDGAVTISAELHKWAAREAGARRHFRVVDVPILVDVNEQQPHDYPPGEPLVVFAGSPVYGRRFGSSSQPCRKCGARAPSVISPSRAPPPATPRPVGSGPRFRRPSRRSCRPRRLSQQARTPGSLFASARAPHSALRRPTVESAIPDQDRRVPGRRETSSHQLRRRDTELLHGRRRRGGTARRTIPSPSDVQSPACSPILPARRSLAAVGASRRDPVPLCALRRDLGSSVRRHRGERGATLTHPGLRRADQWRRRLSGQH